MFIEMKLAIARSCIIITFDMYVCMIYGFVFESEIWVGFDVFSYCVIEYMICIAFVGQRYNIRGS